ncbi:MAG: small nuclear ribonucleoprotein [Hadesarchaea archaeon]|nr:small nuclear ribonucleoprotein [Hadesarchaea archaeon]
MSENSPVDLEKLVDSKVTVFTKGRKKFKGVLTEYDDYMNLVLENAEEHQNEEKINQHELLVIKGGNIRTVVG